MDDKDYKGAKYVNDFTKEEYFTPLWKVESDNIEDNFAT
jgi:hypothetical protein